MGYLQTSAFLVVLLLVPGLSAPLHAQDMLRINEFMAVNENGLDDEDRDEEDWIEIHNAGMNAVNLEGWYLTDSARNLTKWKFPAVTLGSDMYLIVFASGKDRADAAGELHTNFKLSGSGEYLGLVRPDGVTVVSEFSPAFPVQAPDVSYGLSGETSQEVLLAQGAPAKVLVPLNDALEPKSPNAPRPWTLENFDDSSLAVRHDGRWLQFSAPDRDGHLRHARCESDGLCSGPLCHRGPIAGPDANLTHVV